MATGTGGKASREDWKKAKELEEARKAGTVAPEVDDEGNEINPHIPHYIAQAPWYLNQKGPGLKHQRAQTDSRTKSGFDIWYDRGAFVGEKPKKFRKGACENCGAMTHKKKDCLERPRKVGAVKTGANLARDEKLPEQEFDLNFDGKHDRWNGYDPEEYKKVIERFDKLEAVRRKAKAEDDAKKLMANEAAEGSKVTNDAEQEDEDFRTDNTVIEQKRDPHTKTTSRNLRIREDTAKYLRNLDVNSAYYDPKTRSMRENPTPGNDPTQQVYAGDNFVRHTGDFKNFAQLQRFAWDAAERGAPVHAVANPSQAELLHKEFKKKKESLTERRRAEILEKYGGAEHLDAEMQMASTEHYVEYDAEGRVIKGMEKAVARSKYEEDVFPGNHSSVWGSFWHAGRWGYKCCCSTVKSSYCLGEAGKTVNMETAAAELAALPIEESDASTTAKLSMVEELANMSEKERKKLDKARRKRAEKEEKEKTRRYEAALAEQRATAQRLARGDRGDEADDRKRKYNSAADDAFETTEEQFEAYLQTKRTSDDPMANYVDEEDLAPKKESKKRAKKKSKRSESESSESSSGSGSGSDSSESESSEDKRRKKRRKKDKK